MSPARCTRLKYICHGQNWQSFMLQGLFVINCLFLTSALTVATPCSYMWPSAKWTKTKQYSIVSLAANPHRAAALACCGMLTSINLEMCLTFNGYSIKTSRHRPTVVSLTRYSHVFFLSFQPRLSYLWRHTCLYRRQFPCYCKTKRDTSFSA